MSDKPTLKFLSLFVPKLEEAVTRYEAVLGISPSRSSLGAPQAHPFASDGPVVFNLGTVALALYQCDMRATHPGDVGIGVEGPSRDIAARASDPALGGGKVFFGPREISSDDSREMAVFVLPDRHFFEVVSPEENEE